ncbi:hypothetical protein LJK88_04365 [Paenibacillus sp. P26]|nr:hypothetical protein LJK88_04365 [Paenibacillus sp. P26]
MCKWNTEAKSTCRFTTTRQGRIRFGATYEVHYDLFYNAQILPVLFPNSAAAKDDPARRYKSRVGDTFAVTVKNTNRTPGTILFDFLNQAISPNEKIFIPYGGVVRNEAD